MDEPKQPESAPQPNPELDKYRDVDPVVLGTYPLSEIPAILKSIWSRPLPQPPPSEPPDNQYWDVDPVVLGTYPLSELPAILKSVWDRPPHPHPPPEPPDK